MDAGEGQLKIDEAAAKAEIAALRAKIVADPSVVLDDPSVMKALVGAHASMAGRKVVDLRGVLLERLEARLGELEETHRSVISAAYENVAGANQIHRAALAVLAPTRFSGVLEVLGDAIPEMLAVDALRLGLETGTPDTAAPNDVIAPMSRGGVDAYLNIGQENAHRPVVLRRLPDQSAPGATAVFGAKGAELGSEALIRLDFGAGTAPGLLAFGSKDPDRFGPEQGIDLLTFFGGVVERAIRRWVA